MGIEAALRDQIEKATGTRFATAAVTRLKGDASSRSYYRVGDLRSSYVVMVMPPDTAKHSEEASKGEAPHELPFINVHRYLRKLTVRVPEILRYDEAAGMVVLEDLGDMTVERALLDGHSREQLYTQAVDLLAKLRVAAEKNPDPACLAFSRTFDVDLYTWELHHFREWGMEAWSGRKVAGADRAKLDQIFERLSKLLAAEPRGFTHRDYQSRNLMVKDGALAVIDFQDALQAPRQYDLVALLRDSYVELEWPFVGRMVDRYLETFRRAGGEAIPAGPFKEFFDVLTIQRKLKDAARFEYIHRVKGNSSFLVSIPASLRYAAAAMARRDDFADLQALSAQYIPALGQ